MNDLIEIELGGFRYGIWKAAFRDCRPVQDVHGLPLLPEQVSGVANIEGDPALLFDLAFCLGHAPLPRKRPGTALILLVDAGDELEGFVVGGETVEVGIDEGQTLALPDWARLPEIHQCVLRNSQLIPVIDIAELHRCLRERDWERPAFAVGCELASDASDAIDLTAGDFSAVMLSGERFAVPTDQLDGESLPARLIQPLRPAAPHLAGMLSRDGKIRLVLRLAKLMGREDAEDLGVVLPSKTEGLAQLVDADLGPLLASDDPKAMPPIAASPLIDRALLCEGEVIPILALGTAAFVKDPLRPKGGYRPDSTFAEEFMRQAVEIFELTIGGTRYGLPASEFRDAVDLGDVRHLPGLPSIVVGVAEHGGEILPVVDVAVCFGGRSRTGAKSKAVVLRNGDFRALLLADDEGRLCQLPVERQRHLPISQSQRYVYGCYLDDRSVRLILNVETLTSDFDEQVIAAYFGGLQEAMPLQSALHEYAADSHTAEDPRDASANEARETARAATHSVGCASEKAYEDKTDSHIAENPREANANEARREVPAATHSAGGPSEKAHDDGTADAPSSETFPSAGAGRVDREEPLEEGASGWVGASQPLTSETKGAVRRREPKTAVPTELTGTVRGQSSGRRATTVLALLLALTAAALFFAVGLRPQEPGESHAAAGALPAAPSNDSLVALAQTSDSPAAEAITTDSRPDSLTASQPNPRADSTRSVGQFDGAPQEEPLILLEFRPETQEIVVRNVRSAPVGAELYMVERGDTLWDITERFTGNPFNYPSIAANSDIRDPDFILPGQQVLIVVDRSPASGR